MDEDMSDDCNYNYSSDDDGEDDTAHLALIKRRSRLKRKFPQHHVWLGQLFEWEEKMPELYQMDFSDENPLEVQFMVVKEADVLACFTWTVPAASPCAAADASTSTPSSGAGGPAKAKRASSAPNSLAKAEGPPATRLFPDVPPTMRFLAPRLDFPSLLRLEFWDCLLPARWNLCQNLTEVLVDIREFTSGAMLVSPELALTEVESELFALSRVTELYGA